MEDCCGFVFVCEGRLEIGVCVREGLIVEHGVCVCVCVGERGWCVDEVFVCEEGRGAGGVSVVGRGAWVGGCECVRGCGGGVGVCGGGRGECGESG